MSHTQHKSAAPTKVSVAVITLSDTRDEGSDKSGQLIKQKLEENGHQVMHYAVVKDTARQIKGVLAIVCEKSACQAVILNGGTGISPRDNTFEVVDRMLDKRIPGFGEIFRFLSYQEIGSAAIMSRATAGTYRGRIIMSLPGSTGAVRLAMDELILPELGHLVATIQPR
ncbi:MAG: molybdenum cofactor biosynthesis protein MoaB [Gemmatimonadetes bacterium]|nr:molybdenum cofactor biosynthesis protein MoaB [Gemmatimonadota bacterium]MBT5057975.1 molybdenum cofactor biosynthesis protein MoaB [Gemmatimonadota bacterium]MBT5144477.1 molybdenum cofactor biosynthesis protein MoaB [Gemmatimonadota bacterium]MBT5587933.1 molybdenum cofactor biosynthesis protein MoaB [Gemmatimonadota bacterium]MBT5960274.1 molybdenum cofactor biosynthesis protein MoaB [Gemmatimonadota bacterium]